MGAEVRRVVVGPGEPNGVLVGSHGVTMHLTRLVLYPLLGALFGYGYHRLVGCRTGACPITRSPYISTVYGAVIGLLSAGSGP